MSSVPPLLYRAPFLRLAALPLTLALPPERTEVRFAPEEGLRLRKSLRSHSEQSLDSSRVTVGSEEQEPEQERRTKTGTRLVVVDRHIDRYVARDGERVT